MNSVLITGSSGLIGSEAAAFYDTQGVSVHGVDNHLRGELVGSRGDTRWNLDRIRRHSRNFVHHEIDVRDREGIFALFERYRFDLVIHCAAQPSHERARHIPLDDFEINALGTLNLLEATRRQSPDAVFVLMSTNKVYGDAPNEVPLVERETRWECERLVDTRGIDETCRIDRSTHSIYGASKLAADVMTQEYGRYYGLKTGVFRGGCMTGPNHAGCELHGFLSHLVKTAVRDEVYTVYGYKGKQVRDLIHSADVVAAIDAFAWWPRAGEVYNIGGGRANSASILEIISMLEHRLNRPVRWRYEDTPRQGDHIYYVSNLHKLTRHYPGWRITRDLESIVDEMVDAERLRLKRGVRAVMPPSRSDRVVAAGD